MAAEPTRHRRTLRRAVMAIVVSLLILTAVGIVVIQFPTTTRNPPHVDAVVVLGALDQGDMAAAGRLLEAGTSSTLVLSVADGEWGNLCRDSPPGISVICFHPDPSTTQGEAKAINQLAAENGWRSLAVVTWTTHVARSRVLLSRCFDGDLYLVDYPDEMTLGDRVYEQLYQSASFVKVLLQPTC